MRLSVSHMAYLLVVKGAELVGVQDGTRESQESVFLDDTMCAYACVACATPPCRP